MAVKTTLLLMLIAYIFKAHIVVPREGQISSRSDIIYEINFGIDTVSDTVKEPSSGHMGPGHPLTQLSFNLPPVPHRLK